MDVKLSERLASFIFKIETLFSETKCPPIILHYVLEALNTNNHLHENHQIDCLMYFNAVPCCSILVVGSAGDTVPYNLNEKFEKFLR